MYPVDLRGLLDLTTRQGAAAAAEFQKILDQHGLVQNCATGALARLGEAEFIGYDPGVAIGPGPKKPSPACRPVRVSIHQIKSLAVTYFHIDKVDTSIGAERFHFRVRKGIGWFPLAMAARQTGRNGG